MKEIIILSAKHYEKGGEANYGDCILINTKEKLFIYDCGSEEHANEVIKYMNRNGFDKASLVLSHNDADHFDGITTLLENECIESIYTVLLLKHVDAILNKIDDGRRNRESLKKAILEKYDNIEKLSGCNLKDIYDNEKLIPALTSEISIVGPEYSYMIETVAKDLDGREGDTKDGETNVNATSVQLSVKLQSQQLLLSGDSSYAAIEDKVRDYDIVQLPHHGKIVQAKKIFEEKWNQTNSVYVISDNTGNSNGGSDNLEKEIGRALRIYNTKNGDDITIDNTFFKDNSVKTKGTLGL